MQFLSTAALLSFAAIVAADQTFSLTAVGGDLNTAVTSADSKLTLENGDAATILLEEPAGYASINGQYLQNSPDGIILSSKEDASSNWGVADGKFRLGDAGTNNNFYACPAASGYTIQLFACDDGTSVDLIVGDGAAAASSTEAATSETATSEAATSEAATSEATTSEAATSEAATTSVSSSAGYNATTIESHTVVTITECPETVTDCPAESIKTSTIPLSEYSKTTDAASVTSYENAAGAAKAGAAVVLAGAAAFLL